MEILILSLALVTTVSGLIKITNSHISKKQQKKYNEYLSNANVVKEEVSYTLYKKIAKRASVKNTTIRVQGDFFDFILLNIDKAHNPNYIENQLAGAKLGDDDE